MTRTGTSRRGRWVLAAATMVAGVLVAPDQTIASTGESDEDRGRVCVFTFTGPGGARLGEAVSTLLAERFSLYPRARYRTVAKRLRIRSANVGKPAAIRKVSRKAHLDYVLRGHVERGRKGTFLVVEALDGRGETVLSHRLKVRGKALGTRAAGALRDEVVAELAELRAWSSPADSTPEAPRSPGDEVAPDLDEVAPDPDEVEPELIDDSGWVFAADDAAPSEAPHSEAPRLADAGSAGDVPVEFLPLPPPTWAGVSYAAEAGRLRKRYRDPLALDAPDGPALISARAGGAFYLRSTHNTLSPAEAAGAGSGPIFALDAAVDLHPGALLRSPGLDFLGVRARLVHALHAFGQVSVTGLPATTPGAMAGLRDFSGDIHAEIATGHPYGPTLEPTVGAGILDLRPMDGTRPLYGLRHVYGFAGLWLQQPLVPERLYLEAGGTFRLVTGAGAGRMSAYSPGAGPPGIGVELSAGLRIKPVSWLTVSGGWRYQRMLVTLSPAEGPEPAPVSVLDVVHGFHLAVGIELL